MTHKLTLILGGARSGKSAHAQQLAAQSALQVLYVATAEAGDAEMTARIIAHRAARPAGWQTLEAPRQVARAIVAHLQPAGALPPATPLGKEKGQMLETEIQARQMGDGALVLIDCLTLLASNILIALPEPVVVETAESALDEEIDDLLDVIFASQAQWIIVSNEVGLGLVPPYPLGRAYRDGLGRANQRLAAAADRVIFMVSGIPMVIKP